MSPWTDIATQISIATGIPFAVKKISAVGGGCINQTHRIEGNGHRFFVKLNHSDSVAMFEAEAAGLQEIHHSGALRVPMPVCWGRNEFKAWLVLEYLEMGSSPNGDAASLGLGLAAMHRLSSEKFGWKRDNTIGATPQINNSSSNWVQFWRKYRLGYQLELARVNGHTGKLQTQGEQLMAQLESFFPGQEPVASLLHGDLWSGNYNFDCAGRPVLFDPAPYYGDRETDIAMTELFGGFPAIFYTAYREAYPLDPGYAIRKTLYNLYHVLNHLNLFGDDHRHQAEQMMGRLLAEIC
jgi:fructosamine-3-kinase